MTSTATRDWTQLTSSDVISHNGRTYRVIGRPFLRSIQVADIATGEESWLHWAGLPAPVLATIATLADQFRALIASDPSGAGARRANLATDRASRKHQIGSRAYYTMCIEIWNASAARDMH